MSTILLLGPDTRAGKPRIPAPAAWLGGAGLVPFVALVAAAALAGPEARAVLIEWLVRYGAVIVTFVGALHWGALMRQPDAGRDEQWLHLGWSVIPALGAWVALDFAPPLGLATLIALFALQLAMDRRLVLIQNLVPWFLRLRIRLTIVAVVSLAAALVLVAPGTAL